MAGEHVPLADETLVALSDGADPGRTLSFARADTTVTAVTTIAGAMAARAGTETVAAYREGRR